MFIGIDLGTSSVKTILIEHFKSFVQTVDSGIKRTKDY